MKTRPQIVLIGNPNTGKSALFNRLTGARQHVGNYPGITIEKKLGTVMLEGGEADVTDLPGLYSVAAISPDERIVLNVLMGRVPGTRRPDLIVNVLDAGNLRRNLFLTTQLAEAGIPMVVVLNLWDSATRRMGQVDHEALSARLGVPVIPTIATKGFGLASLKDAMSQALRDKSLMQMVEWPRPVSEAVQSLQTALGVASTRNLERLEADRLLFDLDSRVVDDLTIPPEQIRSLLTDARESVRLAGYDPAHVETTVRGRWLDTLLVGLQNPAEKKQRQISESMDDLLTHRVFGLLIFTAVMYVVFQSIYTLATPFMDGIEYSFQWIGNLIGAQLSNMPILRSLIVDGVIAGVGGVLVFLPQIGILFLFITLLEDAGYMPRAAFLMDRLFGWCGLSGKSFVPMLSSYACAVPGIMATRTIQSPKARLTTILICPLMSCSARLPVYVLLIGAFIEPQYGAARAGLLLFAMHFVGLALAIPVAFVFNRLILRGSRVPFVLEMPSYRVPQLRDVAWRVYSRAREFVLRAGTIIFAMSILIWVLCYFPRPSEIRERIIRQEIAGQAASAGITELEARPAVLADAATMERLERRADGAYLEQSFMGRFGHLVQPLFAPAGFDWKITVGVLASFPAREVIISTLGILYNLGSDVDTNDHRLNAAMAEARRPDGSPVFTPVVAVAIMVFFALCSQCMATLVAISREAGTRWAFVSFTYMTLLAWLGAVLVYQLGTRLFGSGP